MKEIILEQIEALKKVRDALRQSQNMAVKLVIARIDGTISILQKTVDSEH